MRATIAEIIVEALEGLGLEYPAPDAGAMAKFDDYRKALDETDG